MPVEFFCPGCGELCKPDKVCRVCNPPKRKAAKRPAPMPTPEKRSKAATVEEIGTHRRRWCYAWMSGFYAGRAPTPKPTPAKKGGRGC